MAFKMFNSRMRSDDSPHCCESCGYIADPKSDVNCREDRGVEVIVAVSDDEDPDSPFHLKCPRCRGFMRDEKEKRDEQR